MTQLRPPTGWTTRLALAEENIISLQFSPVLWPNLIPFRFVSFHLL